jgi:hypothetical protein
LFVDFTGLSVAPLETYEDATDCKVERAMRAIAVDSFKVGCIDELLIFSRPFGAAVLIFRTSHVRQKS